ncbi:MAG: aconitate hydratase AcnA [Chloroflexi bacterium]|nr:aconitate hydratase AcnA [Chloroflexota bacterium]
MTSPVSSNPSEFSAARGTLQTAAGEVEYVRLPYLADRGLADLQAMPVTVKVFLENLLRNAGNGVVQDDEIRELAAWHGSQPLASGEIPFYPARVVLQDFTGVPCAVDLAAMRSAMARMGGHPDRINPLVPAELVIDHSVQVDAFGSADAFRENVEHEYGRNLERYALLRWTQQAFENFKVVPPGTGIVHQVNLEYLAQVVYARQAGASRLVYPDSLVGTDSHTTMVNGLGVLGWGVGGIEAEAVLLGQPLYLLMPEVLGFRFTGRLPEGATATDLVLTVTEMLRKRGVVGKFVEFTGTGLSSLSLADRATISNMCPEYGATAALFPVDGETLRYLRLTGRDEQLVDLVERYCKEQGLFRHDDDPEPVFNERMELDLATVQPSMAGPRRPQDKVTLDTVSASLRGAYPDAFTNGQSAKSVAIDAPSGKGLLKNGSVVIAAITSCTNTSNPAVMIGAGLLAKKAVTQGLTVSPTVKTSLAPGSRVVTDYLKKAELLPYLEALGFHVVGYGCTTCIGNSGPLPEPVAAAVQDNDLYVAAVLSGNRNFEGRVHPQVRPSYLASPPLVVAYALAGTVDTDLTKDPLGKDRGGRDIYLRDIWPTQDEVNDVLRSVLDPEMFRAQYGHVFDGDSTWQNLPVPDGGLYAWDAESTYVQEPPYFQDMAPEPGPLVDIRDARVLALLGDSITTDHISPAGSIPKDTPAGRWLVEHGVSPREFNSYGARRGNHEVMVRGTFGNIRLRNELAPGKEGDWTVHQPDGDVMRIYEASVLYQSQGTQLVVIAGKEYGTGSSRDWAAKGTRLLGINAVIAESYERIHRSNLVGMGVLPLQFQAGEGRQSLGITGRETFDITGIASGLHPGQSLTVQARREDGTRFEFEVQVRIDTPIEVEYYRHGGILPYVLRLMLQP